MFKKVSKWRLVLYMFSSLLLIMITSAGLLFLTPLGNQWRLLIADTLITTQHRHWAAYVIGKEGLASRVSLYQKKFDQMGEEEQRHVFGSSIPSKQSGPPIPSEQLGPPDQTVRVEPIERASFKGYILTIPDPKKIRLVVPNRVGKGEKVSSMVNRTGAIAGVNAGGFADPNWKGNGFVPIGLVMSGGQFFYNNGDQNARQHIVGIDLEGNMIAGKYSIKELVDLQVQEAVTFSPRFIVNGKGLVKNQADGWGIAPRTAMAQKKDGTILFIVIDGRQAHSIGASLYDIQEILLEHGAVIAANLDGGSSSVLVYDNQIVNSPASKYGERYIPTAWLVFEDASTPEIANIWKGLDLKKLDAAKW